MSSRFSIQSGLSFFPLSAGGRGGIEAFLDEAVEDATNIINEAIVGDGASICGLAVRVVRNRIRGRFRRTAQSGMAWIGLSPIPVRLFARPWPTRPRGDVFRAAGKRGVPFDPLGFDVANAGSTACAQLTAKVEFVLINVIRVKLEGHRGRVKQNDL